MKQTIASALCSLVFLALTSQSVLGRENIQGQRRSAYSAEQIEQQERDTNDLYNMEGQEESIAQSDDYDQVIDPPFSLDDSENGNSNQSILKKNKKKLNDDEIVNDPIFKDENF